MRRAGGHGVGQGEERPSVGTWPRLKGGVTLAFKKEIFFSLTHKTQTADLLLWARKCDPGCSPRDVS